MRKGCGMSRMERVNPSRVCSVHLKETGTLDFVCLYKWKKCVWLKRWIWWGTINWGRWNVKGWHKSLLITPRAVIKFNDNLVRCFQDILLRFKMFIGQTERLTSQVLAGQKIEWHFKLCLLQNLAVFAWTLARWIYGQFVSGRISKVGHWDKGRPRWSSS